MTNRRFGLDQAQVDRLLAGSMKPEEIAGDPVTQHERICELLSWFARPPEFAGNLKWLKGHAMELAYYIATGGNLQAIDLRALRDKAFREGFNVTADERRMLERHGYGKESAK